MVEVTEQKVVLVEAVKEEVQLQVVELEEVPEAAQEVNKVVWEEELVMVAALKVDTKVALEVVEPGALVVVVKEEV